MKKVTIKGYSVNEIKAKAPFQLVKNATIMWKKAGSPTLEEDLKAFMKDYLEKHTKNAVGQGCFIILDSPVQDSRENPYKIHNIQTDGPRKFKRVYELVNTTTGAILGSAFTKEEAINLAKIIVSDKREDLGAGVKHICRISSVVVEGVADAFTFEYTPSANTKEGTFLCFGIEA